MLYFTSFIYFFVTGFFINYSIKNDVVDYENYNAILNYILNSSVLKDSFKNKLIEKPDTISIHISKQLLSFNGSDFLNEIISNEFPNANKNEFKKLHDALSSYYKRTVILDTNSNLSNIYKNVQFNTIVFFSEQIDNKIIAELRPYNSKSSMKFDNGRFIGYKDNLNYFDAIEVGDYLQLLFYMDCGKVEKVYHKIFTIK